MVKESKTVYIIPIEPIETRYTAQWYDHIRKDLRDYAKKHGKDIEVHNIAGEQITATTTPGAFLDFGATNVWKSTQLEIIAKKFNAGVIKPGDVFLYTDAWNPTVIQLKYMSKLLQIPVKILGIWHAGSYDEQDFLGRLVGDEPWVRQAEKSMYACYDVNIFATQFHMDMFMEVMNIIPLEKKAIRSGFPMSYMPSLFDLYSEQDKKDTIVFPHRLAPEKQPEIFRDLAKSLPEYNWIVCQDNKLTKSEYHKVLNSAKIVFSANLQETLGITTCIEGPLNGAVPMAPNRLSYTEIFENYPEFMYESEWTESWDKYLEHKDELISHIRHVMKYYNHYAKLTKIFAQNDLMNFIKPSIMYDAILED